MKKRILLIVALALCGITVMGAAAMRGARAGDESVVTSLTNLAGANSTATTGNKLKFDDLSVSASDSKTFDTSKPNLIYDFSLADTSDNFQHGHDTVHSEKDGYYTFTITGSDPYLWLGQPNIKGTDAQYAKIVYRTDLDAQGEFFVQRSDNVQMGQEGSHIAWRWNATGEWETIVLHCGAWANSNASISIMRLDPMANGAFVNGQTTIDIAYIAFFATEEDADSFNYE